MILHIPHSSKKMLQSVVNLQDAEKNHQILCDLYTDELFKHPAYKRIVAPYSRFSVDVERFRGKNEPMEKLGMGYRYTMDALGNDIVRKDDIQAVNTLYDNHHAELAKAVEQELFTASEVVIVDCHSFPDEQHLFHRKFIAT